LARCNAAAAVVERRSYSHHHASVVHQILSQQAVRQTIEWLDHHDILYRDLCFMKDKAAVGADPISKTLPRMWNNCAQTGITPLFTTTNAHPRRRADN
jgi:hypothetical protein